MSHHLNTANLLPLAFCIAILPAHIAQAQDTERNLTGMIGVGVSSSPTFSGSDKTSSDVFPIIDLMWRDRYFLNDRGLGFYAVRNARPRDLSLSFAVGYDFDERLVEDDARLLGLKDVEAGAIVSAVAEYDAGFAALEVELNRGLGSDGHEGTRATFAAEFTAPVGKRIRLSAKPFVTWADGSYNRAFYGVTTQEAATSAFQAFDAGSGLQRAGIELQASYSLTPRSGVFVGVDYTRLLGDAQDSPISFDYTQTAISTGVFFRF